MSVVTLSSGQTVTVYPVPPFALSNVEAHLRDAAPEERERVLRETAWLIGMPDVTPPEDWQFPRGLRYAGIAPRAGDEGRVLDYIEYGLILTGDDARAVQTAMYGLLTEDEIGAAEVAFRLDGGRTTTTADPF